MNTELAILAHRMVWDHSQAPAQMRLPAGVDAKLRVEAKQMGDEFVRMAKDRYGHVPPEEAAPKLDLVRHAEVEPAVRARLIEYVSNQGDPANEWVTARAAELFETASVDPFDCLLTAVHEFIVWQHAYRPDPIGFVVKLGTVPPLTTCPQENGTPEE